MPYGEEDKREKLRELGARVRAKREELGMSLEQVSEKTKIRSKYLIAVEEGDDSVSPGKTYFRAFLKTYATFLGLDGAELSGRYREIEEAAELAKTTAAQSPGSQSEGPRPAPSPSRLSEGDKAGAIVVSAPSAPKTPSVHRHTRQSQRRRKPPGDRRRRSGAVWLFLVLAAMAAAAFYITVYRPDIIGRPKDAGKPPTGDVLPVPSPVAPADPPPEKPSEPAKTEPAAAKVSREDPSEEKTVWSVDRSPVELVLKMSAESDSYCWVSVVVDGEPSFERTLTPKEEVRVTAKKEIAVRAGKPWAVNVHINGRDMGPAGKFGPVKDLVFRSTSSAQ